MPPIPITSYYKDEGKSSSAKKQGTLKLSFVVEIDGSLSNIRIAQSLEKALDEEAITAFEKISKPGMWRPAMIKGEQVRFRYIIPINFEEEGR